MSALATQAQIVFFGTPLAAAEHLRALLDAGANVAAVVTQEDKPAGRGQELQASPVKQLALERGLPVFQPRSLKKISRVNGALCAMQSAEPLVNFLNAQAPLTLFVVVAYGKLLPATLLNVPERGVVNVHFSLLPRWRGAAPIQRAILAGDRETGVGLMQMVEGLDQGPLLAEERLPIAPDDNSGSLHDKLVSIGSRLLVRTLPQILAGESCPRPQTAHGVTHAEKWERADSRINWSESAEQILNRIRASAPRPGAQAKFEGQEVKIFAAQIAANQNFNPLAQPGEIVEANRAELILAVGGGAYLALKELQFPGKKRLAIADILRGRKFPLGARFE